MNWTYSLNKKSIVLDAPPRMRKKVTATRFAGILSLNDWVTDFQMWCEITKVAQPPFEDNKYTLAGKAIEPKLIQLMRDTEFELEPETVLDPLQFFGNNYKDYKFDFFKDTNKILGGMWDAVQVVDEKITTIIECKTTSRPQDWVNGVPVYYKCQGLLYAYLTKATKLFFPVAFLKDEDYAHPENFACTPENTKIYEVSVDSKINWRGNDYTIEQLIQVAQEWYDAFVETGVSPEFDENKDSEYLKILRMNKPSEDLSLDGMTEQALQLEKAIEDLKVSSGLAVLEKQLKKLKEDIKTDLLSKMGENDNEVVYNRFCLSKSIKMSLDEYKLKEDNLYEKYLKQSESYTLRIKKEK